MWKLCGLEGFSSPTFHWALRGPEGGSHPKPRRIPRTPPATTRVSSPRPRGAAMRRPRRTQREISSRDEPKARAKPPWNHGKNMEKKHPIYSLGDFWWILSNFEVGKHEIADRFASVFFLELPNRNSTTRVFFGNVSYWGSFKQI